MKRVSILLLLALGCAAAIWAADPPQQEQPAGMPPTGAPPEMKLMAGMVGEFTVTMQYNMGDTTKWSDGTGTSTSKLILDGCALESTFESQFMGMPLHGSGITCYSREKKKWQMTWIDNWGASVSLYEGDFADGRFVVQGEDMMQGQKFQTRITTYNITPDKYDWLMEMSLDGGKTFMSSMKATYTKKK